MGLLHLNYNLFIIVYVPRRFIVHINKFSNKIYKKNKLHVVMYIYIVKNTFRIYCAPFVVWR